MSDVRVNLLPTEVHERNRQRRNLLLVGLGVVVLLAVLAVGYFYQAGRVDDAESRLAAEEQQLQALEAELAQLEEYEALEQRVQDSTEVIATAMAGEVSVAGLLQDVAAVMPGETQLDTLNLTVTPEAEPAVGDRPQVLGQLGFTGRSLEGHAPGLERLLLEFDKVASLSDLFFSSSTLEEDVQGDIVSFSVEADVGPEALTRRYIQGLPEGLR